MYHTFQKFGVSTFFFIFFIITFIQQECVATDVLDW